MPKDLEAPVGQDDIALLTTEPPEDPDAAEESPVDEVADTPGEEKPGTGEESPVEEEKTEEEEKSEEKEGEEEEENPAEEEDETLEELEGEERRDPKTGKPLTIGQALQAAYRQYPKLKPFLADPEHKDLRYEFFRGMEIGKVFSTVPDAKRAKQEAEQFNELDTLYYGNAEDKKQFIHQLWENSLDKETGKSDGHFEEIQVLMAQYYIEDVIQKALTNPDIAELAKEMNLKPEQVHLAAIIMGKVAGVEGVDSLIESTGRSGAGVKEPTETAASRRAKVERQKFEEERTAFNKERQEEYEAVVRKEFSAFMDSEIGQILNRVSGLESKVNGKAANVGLRKMVAKEIIEVVANQIRDDKGFSSRIAKTLRSGNRSPERAEQALRELKVRGRQTLRNVVRDVLSNLGYSMMRQQETRQERSEAGARRREPASGGAPGRERSPATGAAQPKSGESYQAFANRILTGNP